MPVKQLPPKAVKLPTTPVPTEGIWSRIKPIGLDWNNVKLNILIYGDTASGKTTCWSTFPKPILAILCSGGKRKADELWSIATPENEDVIRQVHLDKLSEITELIDGEVAKHYQTVVIDHLTGFQDVALREVMGIEHVPEQKKFAFAGRKEWGKTAENAKEVLASMLDLDCNIVWTAHEKVFDPKDEEGKKAIIAADGQVAKAFVGPALTPALANWVNGAVNFVCQAYTTNKVKVEEITLGEGDSAVTQRMETLTNEVDYWLRVEPSTIYKSKVRIPRVWLDRLKNIKDPSYQSLMAMLKGENK
jgi:hypothetical protein